MENPIAPVWGELKDRVSSADLDFLKKCFRAYSSKAHIHNVLHDLDIMKEISPPPQRVLDFGCGIGLQSFLLSQNGYEVYGLETVEDKSLDGFFKGKGEAHISSREASMHNVWNIIKAKVDVDFRFYDGLKQPFADGYFDIVFSYAVLEHIPAGDIPAIISEIHRTLKPGGIFYIFQLPRCASYTEFIARKLGMESHPYLWDMRSMEVLLNEGGFSTVYSERVDMLLNHPYRIVNPLFPILRPLNNFLAHTPLSYFAHHLTVVARKTDIDSRR
ncbi:class I SAM-dependent methyltransferase [candidate division WOR-3 bacterium]|nr:class I SAM-dependent methyltransferase [candidate division WOR-3 bacterium]